MIGSQIRVDVDGIRLRSGSDEVGFACTWQGNGLWTGDAGWTRTSRERKWARVS